MILKNLVVSYNIFLLFGFIIFFGKNVSSIFEDQNAPPQVIPYEAHLPPQVPGVGVHNDYDLSAEEKRRLLNKFRDVYLKYNFTVEEVNGDTLILNGNMTRSVVDLKAVELEEQRLLTKFARIAAEEGGHVQIVNNTLFVNDEPHHLGELKYAEEQIDDFARLEAANKPKPIEQDIVKTEEENILRRFGELAADQGFKVRVENNMLTVDNKTFTVHELRELEKEIEKSTRAKTEKKDFKPRVD